MWLRLYTLWPLQFFKYGALFEVPQFLIFFRNSSSVSKSVITITDRLRLLAPLNLTLKFSFISAKPTLLNICVGLQRPSNNVLFDNDQLYFKK